MCPRRIDGRWAEGLFLTYELKGGPTGPWGLRAASKGLPLSKVSGVYRSGSWAGMSRGAEHSRPAGAVPCTLEALRQALPLRSAALGSHPCVALSSADSTIIEGLGLAVVRKSGLGAEKYGGAAFKPQKPTTRGLQGA